MSKKSKIEITSKDFHVPHGKKVKLSDWPTIVKPVYTSKDEYQAMPCFLFFKAWTVLAKTGPSGM
jgi:hypothetical protein